MTRTLAVAVRGPLARDGLFDPYNAANRDDCLQGFRLLRNAVAAAGGRCATLDVFQAEGARPDVVLHLDIPLRPDDPDLLAWRGETERWVFLQESEVILPWNWDPERQRDFATVFTWHDGLVDGDRFVKLNHHVPFERAAPVPPDERRFLAVIAGNKRVRHPLELYSARLDAVRWADRERPGSLDLFGVGWDRWAPPPGRIGRVLARNERLSRALARPPAAYRGTVDRKLDVLRGYRWSLCLENARDIPGYITEKLFDVLLAGCVPVYRGADNIAGHVPPACFVDVRDYAGWADLWRALEATTPRQYEDYLEAGAAFLDGPAARAWSAAGFAERVSARLLGSGPAG